MHRTYLLVVTAVVEGGTGLVLLVLPSVPLALLLGVGPASPETGVVARLAGAALLALGVICWFARNERHGSAPHGLVTGVLVYDVTAAALLTYAGVALNMAGPLLWPAAVVHAALAVWCVRCLSAEPRGAGQPARAARP
jgi:hypothetical protein